MKTDHDAGLGGMQISIRTLLTPISDDELVKTIHSPQNTEAAELTTSILKISFILSVISMVIKILFKDSSLLTTIS